MLKFTALCVYCLIKRQLLHCNDHFIILSNIYHNIRKTQANRFLVSLQNRKAYLGDATVKKAATIYNGFENNRASGEIYIAQTHYIHTRMCCTAHISTTTTVVVAVNSSIISLRKNAEFQKRLLNNQLDYKKNA